MQIIEAPVIVGAIGGSGTRVVENILEQAGVFMGTQLNENKDAVPVREFYRKWRNAWCGFSQGNLRWNLADFEDSVPFSRMREEFGEAIEQHLKEKPDENMAWGVKVPQNILFLPFLHFFYPKMRFIQIVRDGMDMVYSTNWNVRLVGEFVLSEKEKGLPLGVQQILSWWRVNKCAHDYGKRVLRNRYLLIRFESLCMQPDHTVEGILDFLKASKKPGMDALLAKVRVPESTGRWRMKDIQEVYEIMKAGQEALNEFGYWNPSAYGRLECVIKSPRWKRWVSGKFRRKRMAEV
jgi:hypothetical protein